MRTGPRAALAQPGSSSSSAQMHISGSAPDAAGADQPSAFALAGRHAHHALPHPHGASIPEPTLPRGRRAPPGRCAAPRAATGRWAPAESAGHDAHCSGPVLWSFNNYSTVTVRKADHQRIPLQPCCSTPPTVHVLDCLTPTMRGDRQQEPERVRSE